MEIKSKDDIRRIVRVILMQTLGTEEDCNLDAPFHALGADSLDEVLLATDVEEAFNLKIGDEDCRMCKTPNEVVELVSRLLSAKHK